MKLLLSLFCCNFRLAVVEVRGKSVNGIRKVFILINVQSQKALKVIKQQSIIGSKYVFSR